MDTLHFRAAGLDSHKKFVMACIRLTDPTTGQARESVKRFGTMTDDLQDLLKWLQEAGVTHVAMESTGVLWKPLWNVLVTRANRWLRRALVEAARAAARKKGSYFNAQYHRIAARRGANRAAMAVAHSLIVVIYHLLKNPGQPYQDLGTAWFDTLDPQRLTRHLAKRLEQLGFQVQLTPKDNAA